MMFDAEHFEECKIKTISEAINIIHLFSGDALANCMVCGKKAGATVVRRIEEPFRVDALLCDDCMELPAQVIHEAVLARYKRRIGTNAKP